MHSPQGVLFNSDFSSNNIYYYSRKLCNDVVCGKGLGGGGGQGLTETFKLCSRQNPCILIPYLIQESNLIFVSLSKSAAQSVFVLVPLSALFFTSHTFFYN